MKVDDLYSMAEEHQIGVYAFEMGDDIPALSVENTDGSCDIALNLDFVSCSADEIELLGHEMGHCMTGAFYNRYSPFDVKQRHENKADRWAIRNILPYDSLLGAMRSGCTTTWALADRFNVPERFVRKAYDYYTGACGLTFA